MYIELKDSCSTSLPSRSMTFSFERLAIIALDTSSLALDHKSMTLLYFSPWVTRPEAYWLSISFTSSVALPMMRAFSSGMTKSFTPMETPEMVE
ncbi:hypothetical protein D3C78_1306960 [compost metagenome]